MKALTGFVLPALSGGLLALSFPKPDISVLAWVGLVPLLYSIRDKKPRRAFLEGLAAGFVFYLATVYWVVNTMYNYGGLDIPVSLLLLVGLSGYLALYFGAFAWLVNVTAGVYPRVAVITAPVFWTALELARNYLLSGFPWNLLGYSQHGNLPLIQFADITGIYGVSALVVMVNAAAAELKVLYRDRGKARPVMFAGPAAAALVLLAAVFYGNYRLSHPPHPAGLMKVALVQGNIEQFHKWDPAFQYEVFNTYKDLTMAAAAQGPDLVVWPETATPFLFGDAIMWPELSRLARDSRTWLMTGSPTADALKGGGYLEHNSAYLVSPDGRTAGRYDKVHLVPFGEYVPLKPLLPFVSRMVTSIGDFGAGTEYAVMRAGKAGFGTAICFEVIFPELVRRFALNGADFMASITNDAWFGRSSAPYQHFNMSVFRAVENRRALIRVANTGITGIILPSGEVKAKTGIFTRETLAGEIPLVRETTFYTRYGDLFAYACAVAGALLLAGALIRRK